MREDAVNRIEAKTTKIVLDSKSIKDEFIRLDNRRDIRSAQVNRLYKVLEAGKHFETPVVTHLQKNKHRLLDGNHRHEAMLRYLEKHPNRKIELWIFYYENLDESQEKEYYTKWNSGIRQTTNDFVKQYWKEIPFTHWVKNDSSFPYPISHIWTSNAIEFKLLVGGYTARNTKSFIGGFSGSAIEFIEKAKQLTKEDYKVIKAFLTEFMGIYGMPDKQNVHYNLNTFNSIMRIWLDNLKRVSYQTMKKALTKLRNCERIIYFDKFSGSRSTSSELRFELLKLLNKNHKTVVFV
jgi:hypothetical protein